MPSATSGEFGGLLARYRRNAGLTQEELAERAQLSARGISDLERGYRRRPHKWTVEMVATALGLSSEERAELLAAARRASWNRHAEDDERRRAEARDDRADVSAAPPAPLALPALRAPLASLLGRETDGTELTRLLRRPTTRLVTLTGSAGVGKTRLALHLASTARAEFPDGVAFVALAAVSDAGAILIAIAEALGLKERPTELDDSTLARAVGSRRLLVILDNCEHLLDGCASTAQDLLESCPGLTILVTCREPLGVAGEIVWPVAPLSIPPRQLTASADDDLVAAVLGYDAVRLFVERAAAAQPSFSLTGRNARAVADVCRRLDGLPLAIELAATWVSLFPPEALARRLDHRLMLRGARPSPHPSRHAPAHHDTLYSAVGWSYDLLDAEERRLFRQLAVFADGFGLDGVLAADPQRAGEATSPFDSEAAEIALLTRLSSLVSKNLVRRVAAESEPCFAMLETIREFAREKLQESGEEDAARERHAAHYLTLAESLVREIWWPSDNHDENLDRFERERENVALAIDRAAGRASALEGLRWGAALGWFWWWRAATGAATDEPAGAWPAPGAERDRAVGAPVGGSATQLAWSRARAGAAYLAWRRADYDEADRRYAEGRAAWTAVVGNDDDVAYAESALPPVTRWERLDATAQAAIEEAAARARDARDPRRYAGAILQLGWLQFFREDWEAAGVRFAEAEQLYRELTAAQGEAAASFGRGWIARERGDLTAAQDYYAASLRLLEGADDGSLIPYVLVGCLLLAADRRNPELAVQLAAALLAPRSRSAPPLPPALRALVETCRRRTRAMLDEARYATAWETGTALAMPEVIARVADLARRSPTGGQ